MNTVGENRDAFVERVAQSLEAGVVPWRNSNLPAEPQQNATSGRSYGGLNALLLMEAAGAGGYTDPRWLTRKEAETHGFKARQGEKSTKLEYWGKDDDGNTTARTYSVFNIQQFYGQEKGEPSKEPRQPDAGKVEDFFKKLGMEPPSDRGTENCQAAIENLIATAAEKSEAMTKIPSPQLKAMRMSIAGTFLMQEAGVPLDTPANAPVTDWAKTVRLNPKELFRATRDAVKLTNEIMGRAKGQEQSTEQSEEKSEQQSEQRKIFEPEIGQRVTFQPYEGEATLTGKVVEKDENSVTMQCGRVTIPALREKGTFAEAPEAERTATKEYAKEQAQNHAGEQGSVYIAKGENAVYNGAIVELTPTYAIQKVGEDAILHRLKDLEKADVSLIQPGQDVSITKMGKGEVTVEPRNKEQAQEQRREGISR